MDHPDGNVAPSSERSRGAGRYGTSHRRALFIGLGVSIVVHAFALVLYPGLMQREQGELPTYAPQVPTTLPVDGITVVHLSEITGDTPVRPADPTEPRDVEEPAVEAAAPRVDEPVEAELVAPSLTAAERFRPVLLDERLWAPLDSAINALTGEQLAELELAVRISAWNDSLAAAAEAERALSDWTVTDGEGRKWGISQGKIHLGKITLPFPFSFGTPPGKRDEVARRAWEWQEIQRGSVKGEVRGSWKERAQAIRERRDRERATERQGERADTTGGR